MATTYSPNLALALMATGDQPGTWGITNNTNIGTLLEQAISGYTTQVIADSNITPTTLTMANGASCTARNIYIVLTGTLTANRQLIMPTNNKIYFISNQTTGGFSVQVLCSGGVGVTVPNGSTFLLVSNGVDIVSTITNAVSNAGNFTCSWGGFSVAPINTTIYYSFNNNYASIIIPATSGTSNSASFYLSGLPTFLQSTYTFILPIADSTNINNGFTTAVATGHAATVLITANSPSIYFNIDGNLTGWTGSGTKGFVSTTLLMYPLT